MTGCCGVVSVRFGQDKRHQNVENSQQKQQGTGVAAWMAIHSNARHRQSDYDTVVAQERQVILDTFARLQAVVSRIQRGVLADFDACFAAMTKQFVTELASLEVLANQAAAGGCCVQPKFGNIVPVLGFAHVPLEDVESILEACWSVVTTELEDVVNINKAKAVVKQIHKIGESVKASLKAAGDREMSEYATAIDRSRLSACHWKGKFVTTYQMDFTIGGIAVNDHASLLAASDVEHHAVVVYELPSGKALARFGSQGSNPRQFSTPMRLCFTLSGTLLIADSNNRRVQEVTTLGDHVRFFQSDTITARVMHVTCNAEVIVAAQQSYVNTFCVFDMRTGDFLRSCGDLVGPDQYFIFWDVTLTFDGTALLIPDYGKKRILVFSLDGTFLRRIGDVSMLPSLSSAVELPDGRVVASEMTNVCLAIIGKEDALPTFVEGQRPCTAAKTLVRYANGHVFFGNHDCVQVFC